MKQIGYFIIIIASLFSAGCGFDCKKYLSSEIIPKLIDGIVIEKLKSNTGCFGMIVIREKKSIDTLKDVCYCMPDKENIWQFILAGDSLHKEKGQVNVEVIRHNSKSIFKFPCCSY